MDPTINLDEILDQMIDEELKDNTDEDNCSGMLGAICISHLHHIWE